MAIDTVNEKRALMMLGLPWNTMPISADGIDQADQQQLLNEYPGLAFVTEITSIRREIAWIVPFLGR